MTASNRMRGPFPACAHAFTKQSIQPVKLVGLGFRYWLSGFKTGDVTMWERAWHLYADTLGAHRARTVTCELSNWVKSVSAASRREIEVLGCECQGFGRDECLAVSMIAACQHKTCPAIRACAFALIESSLIEDVVTQSESFALTLRGVDQVLSPNAIVSVPVMDLEPASRYVQ